MYQRKVDVDMLSAVKSVLADVSSVSPSSDWSKADKGLTLETSANIVLFMAWRSAYPHQPYVDTLHVLPPLRRRPQGLVFHSAVWTVDA